MLATLIIFLFGFLLLGILGYLIAIFELAVTEAVSGRL